MPVLHMETDMVRGTGNQLSQVAISLQQQSQQLSHSIQALSDNWQGPSANIFVGEIQPLLQQLNRLSNAGDSLNQRLQQEVDEWENIGGRFGGILNKPDSGAILIPKTPEPTAISVAPDQTEWFLGELFRNLYITQKSALGPEGSIFEKASKLLTFFESVKPGGNWDYKSGDLKDFADTG